MRGPSGTVTFLFSDIEGSTQRWERDAEAMAAALARHNELLRTAFEAQDGYIFKLVGDAFCVAFASTPEAIGAALEAQRAILAEDFSAVDGIRVRMALHAGYAQEREGDYLGPPLNRVARLVAIGHGGQVLISGSAAALLGDAMPAEITLRDLGRHRLKDLAQPEHVFQLSAPELPGEFPPLRSLDYLPNNLPQQLTSFVGRTAVVAEIKALLDENRLVTLVGTGGAGKTRCAIQTCAELLDRFADGVWIVELAPISDPALVAPTIARVIGVREARNEDVLTTLLAYLEQRQMLLILDNCEHLLDEARRVAAAVVRRCARVRVLATSREPLGIMGENVVRMPSLDESDAVELFVDRARASSARFALSAENAPFVAEVCRRLDGIPLAVELAAARIKLLSPQQLTQKLGERFRLLTGGDKSALPRHQTLRATIDWSFDLLDEQTRAIFRALSIFVGGWTLEAATTVCNADEWEMLDALSSLVDKSLVTVEGEDEERRYGMLVSIREYAAERLAETGEAQTVAAAHARYYSDFVHGLAPLAQDLEDAEWGRLFTRELDNVRAAIDWTIFQAHDPRVGLELLSEIEFTPLATSPHEALRWYDAALARDDAMPSDLVRARLLRHRAAMEWFAGRPIPQVEKDALSTLAAATRAAEPNEIALASSLLCAAYYSAGRFEDVEPIFVQAYAEPERLSRFAARDLLRVAAASSQERGDIETARHRYAEVARLQRRGSEPLATTLISLGELEYMAGNVDAARDAARQATAACARINSIYTSLALLNLAAYAMSAGDLGEARESLREAARLQHKSGDRWLATLIEHHAQLAALEGQAELAAMLAGFADALYDARGEVRENTERRSHEATSSRLAEVFTAGELADKLAAGASLTTKEVLEYAATIHEAHGY